MVYLILVRRSVRNAPVYFYSIAVRQLAHGCDDVPIIVENEMRANALSTTLTKFNVLKNLQHFVYGLLCAKGAAFQGGIRPVEECQYMSLFCL